MEVDIDLPYHSYYICYKRESDACNEVRRQIDYNLTSNPVFKEVKIEMLSKCITVGVTLNDPDKSFPNVYKLVHTYLENRTDTYSD
jgi:hypothetical protein